MNWFNWKKKTKSALEPTIEKTIDELSLFDEDADVITAYGKALEKHGIPRKDQLNHSPERIRAAITRALQSDRVSQKMKDHLQFCEPMLTLVDKGLTPTNNKQL